MTPGPSFSPLLFYSLQPPWRAWRYFCLTSLPSRSFCWAWSTVHCIALLFFCSALYFYWPYLTPFCWDELEALCTASLCSVHCIALHFYSVVNQSVFGHSICLSVHGITSERKMYSSPPAVHAVQLLQCSLPLSSFQFPILSLSRENSTHFAPFFHWPQSNKFLYC